MQTKLKRVEYDYLLDCLKHTRASYEATGYPSYELKQKQLAKLTAIEEKLRQLRDTAAE